MIKSSINTVDRLKGYINNKFNFNETTKRIVLYGSDGSVLDDIDVQHFVSNNLVYISFNCK